jgi:hypothetical protein
MSVGSTIVIKRAVAAAMGVAFISRLACELGALARLWRSRPAT